MGNLAGRPAIGRPAAFFSRIAIPIVLAALVAAVYWPAGGFPFVGLDDDTFIVENGAIRGGLTPDGIRWAVATGIDAGWIPVTWLSRMLDVSLFGMNAGGHHLVNVLLHLLDTLLLFGFLRKATGSARRSALVAALFAVHPLHVESVAWVTERKDVLCAFFLLLSLRSYLWWAARPSTGRYAVAALFFGLALMSKPMMAVTLPFVLVLLDYWPLGRWEGGPRKGGGQWAAAGRSLAGKAPMLALAAAACAASLVLYGRMDSLAPVSLLPPAMRAANAVVSYAAYLGKAVWPAGLAVFYPHPATVGASIPAWKSTGAFLLLAAATAGVLLVRRRPYLAVGWFWFLGTLVPVIGIVQAGGQAMADRYAYIPLIGVSVAAAWAGGDWAAASPGRRVAAGLAAAAAVVALSGAARAQLSYWESTRSLLGRALATTRDNWLAHNNLGILLEKEGRYAEAEGHYREAMRAAPRYVEARFNLAVLLAAERRFPEAAALYEELLRIYPRHEMAHNNLGNILATEGKLDAAARHFREATRIAPAKVEPWFNLGNLLWRQGRVAEAAASYREALRIDPGYEPARAQLEGLLASQ